MSTTKIPRTGRYVPLVVALAIVLLAAAATAQNPPQGNTSFQERITALKESLAKNQAALKAYTWTETTEISLNGEVKKTELKQCQYGPDGKVQKTPLPSENAQAQQEPGRRERLLKKAVVDHKVEELKDYLEKATALVHEYVPLDHEKVQAAQAAGKIEIGPPTADGIATLTITDYVKSGDKVVLGFDTTAKNLRSYQVQSYVEKPKDDDVTLNVAFASLPNGVNYPQQETLNIEAKKLGVKITNSGYTKIAQ